MKNIFIALILSFSTLISQAQDGKFSLWLKNYKTTNLNNGRDIYVYLPPDYSKNRGQNYPVLYMHDGQNLYDPSRAFMGQTWEAEKTLNTLIKAKKIPPILVVGIDNTSDRISEYTHDADPGYGGGEALKYLRLIVNLKSQVDQTYRAQKGPASTAILGSSLGGLVSLYAGITYPHVFGNIAALSPSIWWNSKSIMNLYAQAIDLPLKIYLDSGTLGGERPRDVTKFKDSLIAKYNPQNIKVLIQKGAHHSEYFWAQRLPEALQFLFK